MDTLHSRCAGLDVHKDTVVACARVVSAAQVLRETRTFVTTTRGLLALSDWLSSQGCTVVAMEATGVYWKPVWHILEADFELLLANAQHVKNVPGRKSDVNDANWLADLVAHGLIRASFVPPTPVQELRDLTRTRKQLVREVAGHTQRLQKTLEDANIKLASVVSDLLGKTGRAVLNALVVGETDPERLASLAQGKLKSKQAVLSEALHGQVREHHRFLLKLHLQQIEALQGAVKAIEERLDVLLAPFAQTLERLSTIPGVSLTVAQVIVAEIGLDMSRFPSPDHLISWAGLCPRQDESAGKRRSTRIRHGAAWLKTTLVQAAWAASRAKSGYFPVRFRRLRSRRGAKKAVVALAASILQAAYFVLRDNAVYRDLGAEHFEKRDRQRTVNKLVNQLERLGVSVAVKDATCHPPISS
jgi:transposase